MRTGRPRLSSLKVALARLDLFFLKAHAGSMSPTPRYELDISAYAVLAHAELEQYFEGLAQWIIDRVEIAWMNKQPRATRPLVAMALYAGAAKVDEDNPSRSFNVISDAFKEMKKVLSKEILNNHGISAAHLRNLFCPLGLDVPDSASLLNSLSQFSKLRGDRAHRGRLGARVVASAGDILKYVGDCVTIAEQMDASSRRLGL
jgi:hypothetical protein